MREIKFRAWDKINNEIFVPTSINLWLLNQVTRHTDGSGKVSGKDIEIMQYTGLKDKNGMGLTEVYEGDIISIDGTLKGNIYENDKEPTDIIIPQLGTRRS